MERRLSFGGGGLPGNTGTMPDKEPDDFLRLDGGMREEGRTDGTGSFSRARYTRCIALTKENLDTIIHLGFLKSSLLLLSYNSHTKNTQTNQVQCIMGISYLIIVSSYYTVPYTACSVFTVCLGKYCQLSMLSCKQKICTQQ